MPEYKLTKITSKETTKSRYESDGYNSDVPSGKRNKYVGQERENDSGAGRGQVNPPNVNETDKTGRPTMSKKW